MAMMSEWEQTIFSPVGRTYREHRPVCVERGVYLFTPQLFTSSPATKTSLGLFPGEKKKKEPAVGSNYEHVKKAVKNKTTGEAGAHTNLLRCRRRTPLGRGSRGRTSSWSGRLRRSHRDTMYRRLRSPVARPPPPPLIPHTAPLFSFLPLHSPLSPER